jgi:hypothetical protein
VAAYRAALEERTRERVPIDWATTLHNLATAYESLGGRESTLESLERAVGAYYGSLEVFSDESTPHLRRKALEHLERAERLLEARRGSLRE